MTTIHVDIFDSARYLSTASYSIEEGEMLPSGMAHLRVEGISASVLVEVGFGMARGKAWCLLIYGELGQHPDKSVRWSQSLDSVPTRCDDFS